MAGLMASVLGWAGWRNARLRARQAELEALVEARTADLHTLSLTDPLTGLRNRRYLAQRIPEDLQIAQRQHQQRPGRDDWDLLVFLIDLDHFKAVNDTHGHLAGDTVLVHTAGVLRRVFRDTDTLVRWGGEEFLVVARASQRDHAGELAERLRRELQDHPVPLDAGGAAPQQVRITASIGFVAYPPDPSRPTVWQWDAVVQLVDAALYAAKDGGRNGWVGVLSSAVQPLAGGSAKDWLRDAATQVQRAER
jgi:diguanylate cyclase (GGDEF)-like protein